MTHQPPGKVVLATVQEFTVGQKVFGRCGPGVVWRAMRRTLVVAAAVSILASSGAFAQTANPSPTPLEAPQPGAPNPSGPASPGTIAQTERIIVTGSNIPTAQEVGPNPVLNINRDLIDKSGERTAAELIRNLPVANARGLAISNTGKGSSGISLRGFGVMDTLVLIDGRRVAPYPIGAVGTDLFVDLLSIPQAAIESIEILKDGASTTYGADAVAGVVNIKLRKHYRGVEATVEYGNTLDKDSGEVPRQLVFGLGDEKTSITGTMYFYHRNSIFNRDRGYSARPPFLSSNSTPENLQLTYESVVEAGGTPPAGFGPGDVFFGHAPFGSIGSSPASAYTYSGGRSSLFNFNQYSSTFPELEYYGGFTSFEHRIFGEQLVLFGDIFYNNATSHDELAPDATGDFQTPGSLTWRFRRGLI